MSKEQKGFIKGRMNKDVDERLLPDGEYVDAQNVRLGSTELSEVGAVENSKGNVQLTTLEYRGSPLSSDAVCIGQKADAAREEIYWFVHDPNNPVATGTPNVVDMIVSFNTLSQQLTYHVITASSATTTSTLNFNPLYRVNGIDIIDNLLFFTDDFNEPRKIAIDGAYTFPILNVDQITEQDISVIKTQPLDAPTIELLNNNQDSNYIEDSFISFSYRYRYEDGEYSALSQFSDIAFDPKSFVVKSSSILNEGMVNKFNSVRVFYNSGSNNVIGVDIIYKQSDSNALYVAKKINKSDSLIPNNSQQYIDFSNSDIYTILDEREILRLYDNVPRSAKAQTIIGRMLMYGNYLEGRDLIDVNGSKTVLNYTVESENKLGQLNSLSYDANDPVSSDYEMTGNTLSLAETELSIDLSGQDTSYYASDVKLTVSVTFQSQGYIEADGTPVTGGDFASFNNPSGSILNPEGDQFTISFTYNPPANYNSAYAAYSQPSFLDKTGANGFEYNPMLWDQDPTLTGTFNSLSPEATVITTGNPAFVSERSSRDLVSLPQDIRFQVLPNGILKVKGNIIEYENLFYSTLPSRMYQWFKIVSATASWSAVGGKRSLHSNRDYQVGIVYQDAEGRQTTAFESNNNSVHIGSQFSDSINSLKVNIPIDMNPPAWADRYKFVVKQNRTEYETIFSTLAYEDPVDGKYWLRLSGEQSNKLSDGQELVVKRDANGAASSYVTTTILDVVSQPEDFLTSGTQQAGLYANVDTDGWNINSGQSAILTGGQLSSSGPANTIYPDDLYYPLFESGAPNTNWSISEGDVVSISISLSREGTDNLCANEQCVYDETFTATTNYSDFRDFWIGEGVDLSDSVCSSPMTFNFNPVIDTSTSPNSLSGTYGTNPPITETQFVDLGGDLYLRISSGLSNCWPKLSYANCRIEVTTQNGLLVFETKASETADNIYFENEQSFPIVNNFHESGSLFDDQNQTAVQPAIVNLTFFNCYTFFNGVESYKIKDSILGKKFFLGERATSVSEQDYREIRRNASITYSGIYNEQTNLNRLNEFNLGLANYKDLEIDNGDIQVIYGREGNLLVLQEDKVSYVTIGKNLLTDAVGGGVISSVPEVLGTQIERIEEYGISNNPESFAVYGSNIYFVDSKRSAVINLKGGSTSEQLNVVSDLGMKFWFRDLFQTSFGYQKLGGYDPYMDEYVLSATTNLLPSEVPQYKCGGGDIVFTGLQSAQLLSLILGPNYGTATISVDASNEVEVSVTYDGTTVSQTDVGVFTVQFDRFNPAVNVAEITITPTDPAGDSITKITLNCPEVEDFITVVPVMVTSNVDAGETITNAHNYTDSLTVTPPYTSPLQTYINSPFISQSQQTYVSANIVSQFGPIYQGNQGDGVVPVDSSTVRLYSIRGFADTFDFDATKHSFKYLRTATQYNNNASDIATLLATAIPITNGGTSPIFFGDFVMPLGGNNEYLYLIYDYRENNELKLCYSNTSDVDEACCECFSSPSCVPFLGTTASASSVAACALSPTETYYTSVVINSGVANTQPVLESTVYTSLGCSSNNIVAESFIKLTDNTWVETDANGEVINTGNC